MYRTVIFDLDGTLLDTIGDLAAAANAVCRENGWPEYTVQAVEGMVGHGIPNLVSRFSPAEAQEPQTLERTLAQFNRYYGAHNMELTAPYAGMPELLKKLKAAGVRLAVCSNKADEFSQVIVAHYFPGIFEVIRGNLPGTPVKPDPGVARGILEKLNARPEDHGAAYRHGRFFRIPRSGAASGIRRQTGNHRHRQPFRGVRGEL